MKKLIVIYGPPRTGTTQLWNAIRKHSMVFGSDNTNEPKFDIDADGKLDQLWKDEFGLYLTFEAKEGEPLPTHMVIKSPGYGFKWDFFSQLKDYQCFYIFTDRDTFEVVDSMGRHEMSRKILDFDFESVDCPEHLKEEFKPKWDRCGGLEDEQRILRRAYYRHSWHVKGVPLGMLQASLRIIPYESRLYCANIAYRIMGYAQLSGGYGEFYTELCRFYHRSITFERQNWISSLLD